MATNLPKSVFGVDVKEQAIFDVIMSERASRRQGTHSTKNRGEVSGGGRKPFKQKGTGNARSGSIRAPQWVGGGTVFGPKPNRNYTLKVNKKVKRAAFASALTLKAKEEAILVNDFKAGTKPNTKDLMKQIAALKVKPEFKKLIIVTNDEKIWKSSSNLDKVFATRLANLTVETIINADAIIFDNVTMAKLGGDK